MAQPLREFHELSFKPIDMRPERRDPIGREGFAAKFKFLRPQMRRGEINTWLICHAKLTFPCQLQSLPHDPFVQHRTGVQEGFDFGANCWNQTGLVGEH